MSAGQNHSHLNKREQLARLGAQRFKDLINNAGGTYRLNQVCELLMIDADAVKALVESHKLIVIEVDGQAVCPVWQFTDNGIVPKFSDVLGKLSDFDPVSQCLFMLTPIDTDEGEMSPIELLKKGVTENDMYFILRRVAQFHEQGPCKFFCVTVSVKYNPPSGLRTQS